MSQKFCSSSWALAIATPTVHTDHCSVPHTGNSDVVLIMNPIKAMTPCYLSVRLCKFELLRHLANFHVTLAAMLTRTDHVNSFGRSKEIGMLLGETDALTPFKHLS